MRLLVLGGTVFVGRHIVEAALHDGHHVTLVHRGRQGRELFGGVERIILDRREDLSALRRSSWDAVVDTCGYLPADVARAAAATCRRVERYVFVSSVSARSADATAVHPDDAELAPGTYGALKAACEQRVRQHFPDRSLIVRCGLLVGPHDIASRARRDQQGRHFEPLDYDAFSGRFPYWAQRFGAGSEIVVPASRGQPVQLLDVRDLAAWVVSAIERGTMGTIDVAGQPGLTMGDLLTTCRQTIDVRAQMVPVDDDFLLAHGVRPFVELPFWIPPQLRGSELGTLMDIDVGDARRAGLRWRPWAATVADVATWARAHPGIGVAPETPTLRASRERALLEAWRARPRAANAQ